MSKNKITEKQYQELKKFYGLSKEAVNHFFKRFDSDQINEILEILL